METTKAPRRGRPPGELYPRRVQIYETDEGIRLLRALAHNHGESQTQVIRRLVREAAKREGLTGK